MGKRSNAALLKRARPRTEPFTVLIDVGDGALDAYNDLIAELQAIPAAPAEGPDKHKAARDKAGKALVEANDRMRAEQEFHGRLQVLPLLRWESLKAEFPPREGNDDDEIAGVDRSHAADLIRPCVLFGGDDEWMPPSDEEWADFEAAVGAPALYGLLNQVLTLHAPGMVSVPKLPSDFLRTLGRRSA
jgi:hypothetical protein